MESALEEIEFLALSSNRVEVLRLLSEGRRTRSDLAAATGASQATLGRILGDFEERSWVRREGGAYAATATGELVSEGFADLLDVFETEAGLRGVVRYLPDDALDFDLGHLADATITVPSQTRPNAPVKRLLTLLRGANEVRIFSYAFNEQSLTVVEDRTSAGEQTFEGVFSRSAIDALADDSGLRRRLRSLLDADGAELRIRDEEIPVAVTVVDDAVHLLLRDENGVLQASIDADDEVVRAWARETFERYWESASPLRPEDFSP
jgi:predicted transcriptional regulator